MCLSVSELQASLGGILDSSKAVSEFSGLIDWEFMIAILVSFVIGPRYGYSIKLFNLKLSSRVYRVKTI